MTALPTTATTAKQTATKAKRAPRRKPTDAADDSSGFTIPRERYTQFPPVILPEVPELEIAMEVLDALHERGLTRDQIREVAGSWLVSQAEVAQWEAKLADGTAQPTEAELATAKLAAQMEACILHKGTPSTPAILDATPEQLLDFIDYYEAELDATYPLLDTPDGPQRLQALEKWRRLNGYLWECKARAGLTPATFAVVAGQDLGAKIEGAGR